jgi:hypothetical protein
MVRSGERGEKGEERRKMTEWGGKEQKICHPEGA